MLLSTSYYILYAFTTIFTLLFVILKTVKIEFEIIKKLFLIIFIFSLFLKYLVTYYAYDLLFYFDKEAYYLFREVYIVFILLYCLLAITNFIRNKTYISFFKILVSFYSLTFFHGASSSNYLFTLSYLMLQSMKKLLIKIYDLKINIFSFLFIIILLIPIILFLTQNLSIPYIPNEFDLEKIIYQINASIRGGSEYPSFLNIEHKSEFFFQIILRISYFLYSPFVWDIEKTYHIIGFFDGLLYFILTIYIIINWHAIWRNPILQIFILMFVFDMNIHAIGVVNFCTGIRHRSKFVVMFIILSLNSVI